MMCQGCVFDVPSDVAEALVAQWKGWDGESLEMPRELPELQQKDGAGLERNGLGGRSSFGGRGDGRSYNSGSWRGRGRGSGRSTFGGRGNWSGRGCSGRDSGSGRGGGWKSQSRGEFNRSRASL